MKNEGLLLHENKDLHESALQVISTYESTETADISKPKEDTQILKNKIDELKNKIQEDLTLQEPKILEVRPKESEKIENTRSQKTFFQKAAVLGGFVAGLFAPKEGIGQKTKEQKREPIVVHDKNDKRLKNYNDSLELYNLTKGDNFENVSNKLYHFMNMEEAKEKYDQAKEKPEEGYKAYYEPYDTPLSIYDEGLSTPNKVKGPYGSKIEYSQTKIPRTLPPLDPRRNLSKRMKNLLSKIKPMYFKNRTDLSSGFLGQNFAVDKNKIVVPPTTGFIEDMVDRKKIKKIYPEVTDSIIDAQIKKERDNPYYIMPKTSLDDRFFGRRGEGRGGILKNGQEIYHDFDNKKDYVQEAVSEQFYHGESSYPVYKKPIQPVVYEDPEKVKDSIFTTPVKDSVAQKPTQETKPKNPGWNSGNPIYGPNGHLIGYYQLNGNTFTPIPEEYRAEFAMTTEDIDFLSPKKDDRKYAEKVDRRNTYLKYRIMMDNIKIKED